MLKSNGNSEGEAQMAQKCFLIFVDVRKGFAPLNHPHRKSVIASPNAGLIRIPTSEIMMADSLSQFEILGFRREVFQQRFQPDKYPVTAHKTASGSLPAARKAGPHGG